MPKSIDPNYAYCQRQNRHVSLDQTEGQCRDRHNCTNDSCPLESEFGKEGFSRALELLSANLAMNWTGGRN